MLSYCILVLPLVPTQVVQVVLSESKLQSVMFADPFNEYIKTHSKTLSVSVPDKINLHLNP